MEENNNKLINDMCDNIISDTLETIYGLQEYSKDICMSVIDENGASLMESNFATTILTTYINILNGAIAEELTPLWSSDVDSIDCYEDLN